MGSCASVVLHSNATLQTETSEKVVIDLISYGSQSDGKCCQESSSSDCTSTSHPSSSNMILSQQHQSLDTSQTEADTPYYEEDAASSPGSLLDKKRNSLIKPGPVRHRSIPFIIISQSTRSQLTTQKRPMACSAFLCVPDDVKSF
ncbi:hypothetical protein C9374_014408 [Naegleria lovaniensis]|uniref:FHA domain-containing protein n=1 Tax=Naegleria lovaniensis TaxID=51637 RepID=A0AA88H0S9_NAELO|nr:uncharacterized protein C9374_014408 [Naegleria lovaniensis]KAG2389008.1 hypothetical protein C9374_014408 [Naegleria lovaniensis]